MSQRLKELREKRKKLVEDAQAILGKGDQMSKEDEVRFDTMMEEADGLKATIEREERAEKAAAELQEPAHERRSGKEDREPEGADDKGDARDKAYSVAFRKWMKQGRRALTPQENAALESRGVSLDPAMQAEVRAQSTSTTAGGYLIPEGFYTQIEQAMLAYGGMRQAAFVFRTGTGAVLPIPTDDDTSNEGEIISENAQHNEQDVVFGQKQLDAYLYSSKIIRVSWQLLQDSYFNMDAFLAAKFGERLGRITNRHFTVGTGSSQPNGVVTASTAGKTLASSSAITFDEMIDLKHSVDPAYRQGARWMFHDSTLKALKKIKDSQNRPLWRAGYAENEPDTIDGDPYTINQHMPEMEASAKSVLYGNFQKYWIRDVREMTMLRLVERYADYGQVGFLAFLRTDGELIDAGTNPIKHAVHPSP